MEVYEEFYTLTINGETAPNSKNFVLVAGCQELGVDIMTANPYNYETLTESWVNSTPIPAEADILAAAVIRAEKQIKLEYRQQRRMAYPDWKEQLAYIYDNGIDKWKTDMVDPIKKKYPKPE